MTTEAPAPLEEAGTPPWRPGRRGVNSGLLWGMLFFPWLYVWFFLAPGYAWWLRVGAFVFAFGPVVVLILSATGVWPTGPTY